VGGKKRNTTIKWGVEVGRVGAIGAAERLQLCWTLATCITSEGHGSCPAVRGAVAAAVWQALPGGGWGREAR